MTRQGTNTTSRSWFSSQILWALGVAVTATLTAYFSPSTVASSPTVGGPVAGLTSSQVTQFNQGEIFFNDHWNVRFGLGPVFTNNSCLGCHSTPVAGGSSSQLSTLFGKYNSDGSFNPMIDEGGPLLQPQSIASLVGASCTVPGEVVPSDATVISHRHGPPLFGSGLIDNIPDTTIEANATNEANDPNDQTLGIHGVPNMTADLNGNLRPGRFGFKAFRPTLVQLVADAFQHDLGITNPINPSEDLPQGNPIPPGCQLANTQPNDANGNETMHIVEFLAFLAPNKPGTLSSSAQSGQQIFMNIGCANCHMPSMTTGSNAQVAVLVSSSGQVSTGPVAALSSQTVNLYSDLLLHDMGPLLEDKFPMGQASGSQWRTTPLWGLSLRTVYLHDGRTSDLNTAILEHGGEASVVVAQFGALTPQQRQNLLDFLNSL